MAEVNPEELPAQPSEDSEQTTNVLPEGPSDQDKGPAEEVERAQTTSEEDTSSADEPDFLSESGIAQPPSCETFVKCIFSVCLLGPLSTVLSMITHPGKTIKSAALWAVKVPVNVAKALFLEVENKNAGNAGGLNLTQGVADYLNDVSIQNENLSQGTLNTVDEIFKNLVPAQEGVNEYDSSSKNTIVKRSLLIHLNLCLRIWAAVKKIKVEGRPSYEQVFVKAIHRFQRSAESFLDAMGFL